MSRLKSQSVSQQMMTAGCKTMIERAEGAKSPFSCPKQRLGLVAQPKSSLARLFCEQPSCSLVMTTPETESSQEATKNRA